MLKPAKAAEFLRYREPLSATFFAGNTRQGSDIASRLQLADGREIIAVEYRELQGTFLGGAALTLDRLWFVSPDDSPQSVMLREIAELRPGLEAVTLIVKDGQRIPLHKVHEPFIRFCMDCVREAGVREAK